MSTVINATPTLDKAKYTTGDHITVTIPNAGAVSSNEIVQHLELTLTADDGTQQVFSADVPNTVVKHLGVKIAAVTLDGVAGSVAADGQSATLVAA